MLWAEQTVGIGHGLMSAWNPSALLDLESYLVWGFIPTPLSHMTPPHLLAPGYMGLKITLVNVWFKEGWSCDPIPPNEIEVNEAFQRKVSQLCK